MISTAEPTRHGIDYAIEKDITRYAPLLRSPQDVRVLLGNVVDSVDDGVFVLSASLRFYEAAPRAPAPPQAPARAGQGRSSAARPRDNGQLRPAEPEVRRH